eukprot:Gb_34360 [translate_table: standard]
MQGIKISGVGISFAMAGPPDSPRRQKVGRRKTKEERRNMIESFVQKYKTSNKGEFPSLSLTHKEVGGSFYTVRQIMRELKQEHKSYDTLGTDLEVRSSERQITHSVEPISIPAEISTYISSTSGGEENNHISQLEEDRNQDVLLHNKEQNIANNYVVGTCGINDQSAVKQEIQVVEKPLVTTAVSKPLGMQSLLGTTEGTLYGKEEKNSNKIIVLNECQKNENIHVPEIMGHAPKTKVVAAESVMESCSSSAENQMDYKFLEAQEQEFHPVYVKDNSAPITMYKNEPSPDIPSAYAFGSNSLEKQNLLGNSEELEGASPDKDLISFTRKLTVSYSHSEETLNYMGSHEADEKHFPLDTSKPVHPISQSHSTTCSMDLPVAFVDSGYHEERKTPLPNSREEILEEPVMLADSANSLAAMNVQIDSGENGELDMLKGQRLSSPVVDREQILTGVEAFLRVLLHRLTLSALVVQTWVHSADAYQRVSCKSLDNLSPSNYGGVSTDKTPSVLLSAVPVLGQDGKVENERESMQNNSYDGNCTNISESMTSASTSTEGFKGLQKLETNTVWDNLKAIANGIISFWKD